MLFQIHPDTIITHPTSEVHYILPRTWKFSCDWSKVKNIKTIFLIAIFLTVNKCWSQNIAINTSGSTANTSALLDLSSTTSGFLLPRMTTAERDAIAAPSLSLLIFNTDNARFEYYNGATWQAQNAGALILLSNSEADVTGVATTASVKSFVVVANIYSQIMVEVEIGLDQSGNNNAEWTFDIQYAAVTKGTSNLKLRGNNVGQEHKVLGVLKYSELMTAGGTVQINVTAVTVNGTWRVNSLRVYGII